jgi:hypothetical protein
LPPPYPDPPRPWWWDALAALAFFGQALLIGKLAGRIAGPIAGIFVFLVNLALGYFFARGAWNGLLRGRDRRR